MSLYSHKGLTLIELLLTIAILSIITSLTIGSFNWLVERSSAAATKSNIERAFALARFTAVTEQTIITICPLDSSKKCTNDWSLPTTVFRDPSSSLEITDPNQPIKSLALPSGGYLTPSNSFNGPRKHFQYRSDGSVRGTLGNLTWCPQSRNPESAIHVRINFGGRLAWSRDSDGSGIVETASGTDISC